MDRGDPMRWWGAAAVGLFGLLGVLGVVRGVRDQEPIDGADAARALVEAYRVSRTATYHVSGTFVRRSDDGRELSAFEEFVQRPPDRLQRQLGEVFGRRNRRALLCPGALDDSGVDCYLGPPGVDFDALVESEVAAFSALVSGPAPRHRVEALGSGCWSMLRVGTDPRWGYGMRATLCFDPATGALLSSRVDHGDVVDTVVLSVVPGPVTDADLEP